MTREVELITTPEAVMQWMVEAGVFMDLRKSDIQLLLQYLEKNEYALGTDADRKLVRVNLAPEKDAVTEYSLDELVDQVCDWNYALILEADLQRQNHKGMDDFYEKQKMYETYKRDETLLDRMFDQTKYAKRIEEVAWEIAQEILSQYGITVEKTAETSAVKDNQLNAEKIAGQIADKVREYHTERVR